jgi:hypothetical protein
MHFPKIFREFSVVGRMSGWPAVGVAEAQRLLDAAFTPGILPSFAALRPHSATRVRPFEARPATGTRQPMSCE